VILGASFDTVEDNRAFAEAQRFPFALLSDVDRTVGRRYEVVRAPGEKFEQFPLRHAYLIDPDGVIRRTYDVTDVAGHAAQVLADVEALRNA